MAYDDWSEDMQNLWDSLDGTDPRYLNGWERDYAEQEFERGFTFHESEYAQNQLNREIVGAARDNFFGFMGLNEDQFDWAAWRDEMGYIEK